MTQDPAFIGWLLVIGTVAGLALVGHPALIRIWTMPREQHVATVAAHPVVWALLNAGFALATVTTAAALVLMGTNAYAGTDWSGPLIACGITYTIGGSLWCAVLAARTRSTPLLNDLGPESYDRPPVRLLDALTGGLYQAFVLLCSVAVALLGVVLLVAGGVPVVVGILAVLVGGGCVVWLLVAGDIIPAVLYLPTLLLGIALLAGWT